LATLTNPGGSGDGVVGTTTSHDANGVVGNNSDATARNANKPSGHGVLGATQVPDGAGVFGLHAGFGIGSGGVGLIGVWGGSLNGVGVLGVSAPPGLKGGDGVQGVTNNEIRNGIYGRNESTVARGIKDSTGNGVLASATCRTAPACSASVATTASACKGRVRATRSWAKGASA